MASDPLLAALDADLIESLCESAIDVRILGGEWLFHSGDPGSDIYVIKSGRLEVIRESTGEVLRVLTAGSVVGELAPLMTTARTAGVRAQRDSHLLRIPADEFLARLRSDNAASLNIATRLARIVQSSRPRERTERSAAGVVAVLQCHGGVMGSPVRSRFEQLMAKLTATRVIDQQSVDQRAGRSEIAMELDARIDEAESMGKVVLLFGQADEPLSGTWNHYCARQADRMVLVADPSLPLPEAEKFLIGCDLVFLRPPAPAELTDWLDALVPRSHTVAVSEDQYFGLAPLVRRILGRSTGLVLAGGGARNFAHVGVIEVLLDAGLAIDRVGGCSIGALIGALFALGVAPADMIEILRHELVQRNALNRVVVSLATLPLRPFLGPEEARTLHGSLRSLFADLLLEELPRPMYTNTVDLPTGEIQTVRRGPAWEAVGVSMTLPVLFPPRAVDGRLLVDGGILEPFPVAAMAVDGEGPIIGVGGASSPTAPVGQIGTELRLTGINDEAAGLPSTLQTLLRVMDLVCYNSPGVMDDVDVLITPDVGDTGILQFDRLDSMIDAGREAARRALDQCDLSMFAKRFDDEPAQSTLLLDRLEARRTHRTRPGRAAAAIDGAVVRTLHQFETAAGVAGERLDKLHVSRAPSVSALVDAALTRVIQNIPH